MDVYDGDNYIYVWVYTIANCNLGRGYSIAITRAEGSLSSPRPNRPPTGLPIIGGDFPDGPEVGESIFADVWEIRDRDGLVPQDFIFNDGGLTILPSAVLSFQWLADDAEIRGATSYIYTVADTDLGKILKVRVSFTDDRGTEESVTSDATEVVKLLNFAPTGKPIIVGKLEAGQTLRADVSGISDPNGTTNATFSYWWYLGGTGRDGEEYTLADINVGRSGGWLRVTYTDDAGHEELVYSDPAGVVAPRSDSAATGTPTITGTAQVGETLTADTSGIADADGLTNVTYSYQWIANDGTADTDITDATDSTYTLVADDDGKTMKVNVSFADDAGGDETLTSTATEAVSFAVQQQIANNPATGAPTISGTVQVGDTLTASTSGIADDDGLTNVSYSPQWIANDGTSDTDITDATDSTYTLVAADEGKAIKVEVSFTDDAGSEETLTSTATEAVRFAVQQQIANSSATGAPSIRGTAQVGEMLTADTSGISDDDGLTNVSYSYQWVANDGSSDTDITDATDSTYTLVAADEGKTIKVSVSFTDDAGNDESLNSAATATIAAAPNSPATGAPAATGTAQVGETLTADTYGIADADGLTNVSYRYQWIANDGTADTDITGATDSSYTLVSADEGQTIKVRVSFTDDAGNQEMLTSAPTAVVAAPAQVDSENEPSEWSHLTVVVTEDDSDPDDVVSTFTITWNDAEDCSASYNAYLDGVVGEPIHLGSAASEGEQIAGSLTNVIAETFGFNAKLHCGTIGSGRLVDRLWIPEYHRSFDTLPISRAYLPKPGTYSTEPGLIALTVSSGTLTSAFHNHTLNYTVPDVPNADGRFTLTTTAKADYYNVAFIPGSYYTFFSVCSYGGQQTSLSYGDDAGNRIYPLTDADANTPGFQMDLDEGENVFYIRVWPNCETGQLYKLTVTRAANAPANTPATGAPTIGGTARVGQPLTADTTGIADSDGLENATFAYQWLADDTEIDGATHSTYTLVVADEGQTIKIEVSFTDDADNEERLTSTATAEVAAGAPTEPPGSPRNLTGTANADGTVTLRWGAPNDDSVTGYQILRRRPREGENTLLVLVNDTGSTDTEYTDNDVTPDVLHAYRVKAINAVGLSGQSNFVNVTPTQPAGPAQNNPATGRPTISGTAQVGGTLTVDTSGIGDADGLTNVSYSYQWIPNDGSFDTDNQDALGSSYTLVEGDEGKTIKVEVSFTDDAGNDESLTSVATATVAAVPNNPATGTPTISGTAQVGETLTADTSGIADDDGLSGVAYSYQWLANDADIADATGSTHTLVAAAEGRTIRVRVSFADDAGNDETLTSAATAAVATQEQQSQDPPAKPAGLSATAVFAGGVDLEWNDVAGADSYDVQLYRNGQWIDLPGDGVEISFYGAGAIVSGLDPNSTLWFQVRAKNAQGSSDWSNYSSMSSTNQFKLGRRARPDNVPASGTPVINGTAQVGETLTADTTGIEDGNGLGRVQFRFQWVSHDGNADTDIAGATDSTYTLAVIDEGKTIRLRVSFTDRGGYEETLDSAATGEVSFAVQQQTANNPAAGAPAITGTAQVGETLTVDTSGIADTDGLDNSTFSYQWLADDADIADATGSTHTLVAAAEGRTIRVTVSFADDAGNNETLTSAATATVAPRPNAPATGAPVITGTAQVGQTLTVDTSSIADDDGLTNVSYQYQWVANDGNSDTDIAGSTDSTYTLVSADVGNTIKVRVSFTDDAGNDETLTSRATDAVPVPEPPAKPTGLSAVVSHDTVTLTWDDPQDDTITGYVILRRDREIHPVGTFVTLTGDTGSADTTYTDDTAESDKEYVYRIKAINEHGEVSEISDWVRGFTPAAPAPAG